ncbi:MAG: YdiU family protein [Kaiparowitsia implicata GSE-PSE-MK54-09C]|jgi:uncharacterized protein YdiU (UPF0061 family)|nr:YdiU family protein [Kaiparowitsia implicata GSE-PSE-MK54-09C]
MPNPLLLLNYEPAFESLGDRFYDLVPAAKFPQHTLRFRNDALLPMLGLAPEAVTDADFVDAFGKFEGRHPLLAMGYHGYQFGQYNPALGDGRGFLYGQVRDAAGHLWDLGTKGSGPTPYSRGGDGRLTLKGGVREVLAAEMLHRLGVRTSRCLSLIETGDALWRGDEPSPTRASVMVRLQRSHIRFGTFERLHFLQRPDLIQLLLNHVIQVYCPHLLTKVFDVSLTEPFAEPLPEAIYAQFYGELVQRVADLVAQWMAAGFCHAVLNTDNMVITGESFDYGPYAFISHYDPQFTAAYFDHSGRYAYSNQPAACQWNLAMLQVPLAAVLPEPFMAEHLAQFEGQFRTAYRQRMLWRLGLDAVPVKLGDELLRYTVDLLYQSRVNYHQFFYQVRRQWSPQWQAEASAILTDAISPELTALLEPWRQVYYRAIAPLSPSELAAMPQRLNRHNPSLVIERPDIEAVWDPITTDDNWQPFEHLLKHIWTSVEP